MFFYTGNHICHAICYGSRSGIWLPYQNKNRPGGLPVGGLLDETWFNQLYRLHPSGIESPRKKLRTRTGAGQTKVS